MKKKSKLMTAILLTGMLVLGAGILAGYHYFTYGGFAVGQKVDQAEFQKYAGEVDDIAVPENVKIVALGEATHGNKEFQELKLDVFRKLVEDYGCRTFALESDYGGGLVVNDYIHGKSGITEDDALQALQFQIYQTEQMRDLIRYMADYNKQAAPKDQLSFYGFDMQNLESNKAAVDQAFKELGKQYQDMAQAEEILSAIPGMEPYAQAARCCQQNQELGQSASGDYSKVRDGFMAANIGWIQEQTGPSLLMISGHNGHVQKKQGAYTYMGSELHDKYGDKYFVLGTDFYKTDCNLPGSDGKRITRTFYSSDPLANTANAADMDEVYLDFARLQDSEKLADVIANPLKMGSLGEGYSFLNRILPYTYRIEDVPADLYDGMILIRNATPTMIED